jgi:transcriptional regulator with XRE-family HTH domain
MKQAKIGKAVKAAREGLGLTQKEFAFKLRVTETVIKNIESGRTGIRPKIALLLQEAGIYLLKPVSAPSLPNISGIWQSFYVERDMRSPPYLVRHELRITQQMEKINGVYKCLSFARPNHVVNGEFVGSILIGTYFVEKTPTESGTGPFQLKIGRSNNWLDGYCVWMDSDTDRIECSRHILYRSGAQYEADYERDALAIMEGEAALMMMRIKSNYFTS